MKLLIKNLVFTVLAPCTVAVYLPLLIASTPISDSPMASMIGAVLLTLGAMIYIWCVWDFATAGRGTPAPIDPPKDLVVRGLYRYVRNPMYVGMLCLVAGWATLFLSLPIALYGVCLWGVFHLFVLYYEEPHLRGIFGQRYEIYLTRVGRWLPRIRSRFEQSDA